MFLIERYRHPRTRAMGDISACRAGGPDAGQHLLACARQPGAKVSCESVTGITSLTAGRAGPAGLLAHNRNHWAIENGLHHRRSPGGSSACRMTLLQRGRRTAFATHLQGCRAPCRCCSDLTPAVAGQPASCNTCGMTARSSSIADVPEPRRYPIRSDLDPWRRSATQLTAKMPHGSAPAPRRACWRP